MKMPVLFVGHGSPTIAIENSDATKNFKLIGEKIISEIEKPKAILLISAHWYKKGNSIQSIEKPRQIYDMYGFPKELYEVVYQPSGCRELTDRVLELAEELDINDDWGIDHGAWTVLSHMFPKADIPVVQISVDSYASPKACYDLGEKLRPLRDEGYLVIGSGNIVHNLAKLDWKMKGGKDDGIAFDDFIRDALVSKDFEKVINYKDNPYSKIAAPGRDHFYPLIYALGLAGDEQVMVFNNFSDLGYISMTSYVWGL